MQLLIDEHHGHAGARGAAEGKLPEATAEARREAARRTLNDLRRRLRRERAMGRRGHVGYDLSRHLSLVQMVRRAEAACRAAIAGTSS